MNTTSENVLSLAKIVVGRPFGRGLAITIITITVILPPLSPPLPKTKPAAPLPVGPILSNSLEAAFQLGPGRAALCTGLKMHEQ